MLQRERPRTAGGMLISPQTLCFSSLVWIPQKSLTVLSWLWLCVFIFEGTCSCLRDETHFHVRELLRHNIRKENIQRKKFTLLACSFLRNASLINYLRTGAIICWCQRRKQRYLLWKPRPAGFQSRFNRWFTDGNEAICFHYFHFVS